MSTTTNPSDFTHRQKLADMLPDHAQVVELGVAAGIFGDALLTRNPKIKRYHGVDKWDDHHDTKEFLAAQTLLNRHGFFKVFLYRETFDLALPRFHDNTMDLVYVDGYAHTGQEGGKTLTDWWPKVKSGGIFAGHDFDEAWPETRAAVVAFAAKYALEINVIKGDTFASWWVRKA